MPRLLLAASAAAAGVATLVALPAAADRSHRNALDEDGRAFGSAWAETGRFEALTATGLDDVRLVTGDRWRIRASGDARALAQLRFLVRDEALIVGRASHPRERYGKARIEITAPALRAVTAAGSGVVDVERIAGPRASATIAGSGRTTIRRLEAERLSATLAGSGGLDLAGRSQRADLTIAGSGRLTGDGFTAASAHVTVAGSGSARFRSPGQVRATIVGSGSVTVTGTNDCRQTRMGSGRLVCTR